MLKVKKWFVVLICMLLTVGGGSLQLLAEEEGPEAGQTEVGNTQQLIEEAQSKTVPAGYADMRVGKMMDDGID